MHDFDQDRQAKYQEDRQFRIGGQVFIHRPTVRPELMAAWEDIDKDVNATETLRITDALIEAWLDTDADPTAVERWRELRKRESDPIGGADMSGLIMWLYRQSTRRPTQAPASSETGRETTGTHSTDGSSPAPAEASATSA